MSRRLLRGSVVVVAALAGVAVGWPMLPPDLQHAPFFIFEFATRDHNVVNTPMLHEVFGHARGVPDPPTREARLKVAPGYHLSVYADGIAHPRTLRVTPAGDLLVSQPRKGRVLLVARDADADGRADATRVLLDGLHLPHGIELVGDALFVAEPHAIHRARFDVRRGALVGGLERFHSLPETNAHHMRTLRLGPDGWLYVPIGADCNACLPSDPREGALLRIRLDGGAEQIYATGFRNIAGFDWQPGTDALFANDVGADYLGDDFPPEELNRIEAGGFYGFPYAHGDGVPDPTFGVGEAARIDRARSPVHTFGAHTTPLGLVFLRAGSHPPGYEGAAVLAFHGSWNRTRKDGYRVVTLHWSPSGEIEERPFLSGFERDEDVIGRPVDVAEGRDGSIFVSDDYAGAIYRVTPSLAVGP